MVTGTKRIYIPREQQRRRTAELDAIRLQRRLTAAERAEAASLAHRAYMHAWHAATNRQSRALPRGRK